MSKALNQLVLMSDEHARQVLGCYGNSIVQTPNLDKLAKRGTVFSRAYTTSPICVPARASFATGHYGHTTRHWDNATPYFGKPNSWGHALQEEGRIVGSIGKLHFRNVEDSVGFDFQEIPMHVVNEVGDVLGCVREPLPKRWKSHHMAEKIGIGETSYTAYDTNIVNSAAKWIEEHKDSDKPWTLFVSIVTPHFPLIAPKEFYDLYKDKGLMPTKPPVTDNHEWHKAMNECILYDNFTPEKTNIALTAYYGLSSFMDHQMGKVLDALDNAGLTDSTQVIYTSDHGDNIGERGLWGKSTLFEESAGVPLIVAGPGFPEDRICNTPASLVDVYPTILEGANIKVPEDRPGESLTKLANEEDNVERVVFSEYHAMGAVTGAFMIRKGDWKFVHYVGMSPELYNLTEDPDELKDLGSDPKYAEVCKELMEELLKICDPDEINTQAFEDQRKIIEQHGGSKAVVEKGGFGATPPPGVNPEYVAK